MWFYTYLYQWVFTFMLLKHVLPFHINLKGKSNGNEFPQHLFFCENLYCFFIFEEQLCWVLVGSFFFSVFCFSTLNTLFHSLYSCKVFAKKTANSLMGDSFDVIRFFFLLLVSNSLIFKSFISMCLDEVLLRLNLFGVLWALQAWMFIYFARFGKFSPIFKN